MNFRKKDIIEIKSGNTTVYGKITEVDYPRKFVRVDILDTPIDKKKPSRFTYSFGSTILFDDIVRVVSRTRGKKYKKKYVINHDG